MRVGYSVALALLLVASATVAGAGVPAATGAEAVTPEQRTIEGLSQPLPAQVKAEFRSLLREVARESGYAVPDDVVIVRNAETGVSWIVGTSEDIPPGYATVSGAAFSPSELETDGVGVMFAEEASVRQRGERVTLESLQQTPEQYSGELVRVSGTFAETSYLLEQEGVTSQQAVGFIDDSQGFPLLDRPPARRARYALFNISRSSSPSDAARTNIGLSAGLATGAGGNLTLANGDARFWKAGEATVDIMVLPSGDSGADPTLFPVQTQLQPTATVTPVQLRENADQYRGEIVAIEGSAVGASVSSQETLTAVSQCAPDVLFIPVLPEPCIPAVGDVVLHTGVVARQEAPDEAVPYIGLSNAKQSKPARPEQGQYRLVGRVVAGDELDPRVDAPVGLVVMQRERLGNLQLGAAAQDAIERKSDALQDRIEEQLTASAEEFSRVREQASSQPTPEETSTPDGETRAGASGGLNVSLKSSPEARQNVPGDSYKVVVVIDESSLPDEVPGGTLRLRGNGEPVVDIGVDPDDSGIQRTSWTISRDLGREVRLTVQGQYVGTVTFAATPTPTATAIPTPTPPPGNVSIVEVEQHGEVPDPGQATALTITFENIGGKAATRTVDVAIGDYQVSKSVRVYPGREESITVRTEVGESARVLDVTVDERKVGVVRVGGASTSSGAGPGFGPAVAVMALMLALAVRRLQH
jgi:hypothetical protein